MKDTLTDELQRDINVVRQLSQQKGASVQVRYMYAGGSISGMSLHLARYMYMYVHTAHLRIVWRTLESAPHHCS